MAFDDHVEIVVPAGPLTNKSAIMQAIQAIDPRGSTDLSAGCLRGNVRLHRGTRMTVDVDGRVLDRAKPFQSSSELGTTTIG